VQRCRRGIGSDEHHRAVWSARGVVGLRDRSVGDRSAGSPDTALIAMRKVLVSALAARGGGGLTYVRRIVSQFPADGEARLSILSPQPIVEVGDRSDIEWIKAPAWTESGVSRFVFGSLFFRFLWSRRNDFDVAYYTGGSIDVPLPAKVKRVAVFQNMLPFDPEARRRYGPSWNRVRNWILRKTQSHAFRHADLMIFISEHGREVIDTQIPERRSRGVVIPHGVERLSAPLAPDVAARLPARFALYLSALDVYKAHVELIEAWALAMRGRKTDLKLVLAGPEYPAYAKRVRAAIRRHGLEDEVIVLGTVEHDQVFDLAERAALNLFMSSCENCPNIVLELLSAGRPLLLSSRPPMPELGGPELAYVDPYDVPAIAAAIARAIDDPASAEALGRSAAERAKRFSWEKAGSATWLAILGLTPGEGVPVGKIAGSGPA
jgi:glycosyltransferase involved in cell wall biosynthesis